MTLQVRPAPPRTFPRPGAHLGEVPTMSAAKNAFSTGQPFTHHALALPSISGQGWELSRWAFYETGAFLCGHGWMGWMGKLCGFFMNGAEKLSGIWARVKKKGVCVAYYDPKQRS